MVKVYGTYSFNGLERSPQAGAVNMVDLLTFRELSGFMTPERQREIDAMRERVGAVDVARDAVERQLFGVEPPLEAEVAAPVSTPDSELAPLRGTRAARMQAHAERHTVEQAEEGAVLSAAVMVADEGRLGQTLLDIEAAGKRAGLALKAIPGNQAAGTIGQFVTLMGWVLFSAVLVMFLVVLLVINNALVMATLDRVSEIGTLRAIGASRGFVLALVVFEAGAIGLTFGCLGAALGCIAMVALGTVGIPATDDVTSFFFSGPRLFPKVVVGHFALGLGSVLGVELGAAIYPALLALRVSPRRAMQAEA